MRLNVIALLSAVRIASVAAQTIRFTSHRGQDLKEVPAHHESETENGRPAG